jgi:hypothetical protein
MEHSSYHKESRGIDSGQRSEITKAHVNARSPAAAFTELLCPFVETPSTDIWESAEPLVYIANGPNTR